MRLPRSGVAQWEVGQRAMYAGRFVVPIQRDDEFAFALSFMGTVRAWKLDQISKAVRAQGR
jgi:hypothetical protein